MFLRTCFDVVEIKRNMINYIHAIVFVCKYRYCLYIRLYIKLTTKIFSAIKFDLPVKMLPNSIIKFLVKRLEIFFPLFNDIVVNFWMGPAFACP